MKQTFNVVISALNSQYIHSSLSPWYLLAGIRAYCGDKINAVVEEGTVNEPYETVAARIVSHRPAVVGLSCYIWNISSIFRIIPLIKRELPEAVIVLGGPEVSYRAASVLEENPFVDYIISGEGEAPFAMLINALYKGDDVTDLPGLCCRREDGIFTSEPYTSREDPPRPYSEEYFNKLEGRIAYLETSRGCPYRCAFCLSARCGGVHFFDIERAKKEMILLSKSGAQTIKLMDRTFNANRQRAYEIFEFILSEYGREIPYGVCFHFEIAGDLLDERTVALLATAPPGAIQFEIGVQSFNPKTLQSINRITDIQKLKENIRRILEAGNIHLHIDLIAGLPYEDKESFIKSFHAAYYLKPHMLQLGFLKLLYGAPMREYPEKFPCEYSDIPPYEVRQTPWLAREELEELHIVEQSLDRMYNSGRFLRTLKYLTEECRFTPYRLFYELGSYVREKGSGTHSLDAYTTLIFSYFSSCEGVDPSRLRDCMVCDRLATNSSGILPPVLRRADPLHRKIKRELEDRHPRPPRLKRGMALLYSEPCAVYADYDHPDPVTGEYKLQKFYYDK